jgi:hypothetical protein
MTEQMLREALRDAMAESAAPPSMSSAVMVRTARQARTRRRVGWSGAGCAALAATIAVTAAVLPGAAGPGATLNDAGGPPHPAMTPPVVTPSGTAEPFPTGPDGTPQQDRTATAGVRYEQGTHLLEALLTVVPAGYAVAEKYHQAQFADRVNGVDVWEYLASAQVGKGGGTGQLVADVYTRANRMTGGPCALAQLFWGMAGKCQVQAVGTEQVGVVTQPTDRDRRMDQWAAYKYPDGTVVFVGQAAQLLDGGRALAALPLTVLQLAALAVDERFHLQ